MIVSRGLRQLATDLVDEVQTLFVYGTQGLRGDRYEGVSPLKLQILCVFSHCGFLGPTTSLCHGLVDV